jgi:hypothetical protein
MTMFSVSPAFYSVSFDQEELKVIRIACAAVAAREQSAVDEAAGAGLDEYAEQVKKTNRAIVAGNLASLFKPGQEILIEKEDLEPLAEVIRKGSDDTPEEEAAVLRRALKKVEACLVSETGARLTTGAESTSPTGAGKRLLRTR